MTPDSNQFSAFLSAIIPSIITSIAQENQLTSQQAIQKFYQSKLYAELSDPTSELWHYGPAMLSHMFTQELTTGYYDYPEGT